MKWMVLLYVTNASMEDAKKIAKNLLKKRMIGCANIFPITSMYWWKGEIVDDKEFVLIAKTTKEKFKDVRDEIIKIHPYDTPCVIKLDANPNEKYFKWLKEEVV